MNLKYASQLLRIFGFSLILSACSAGKSINVNGAPAPKTPPDEKPPTEEMLAAEKAERAAFEVEVDRAKSKSDKSLADFLSLHERLLETKRSIPTRRANWSNYSSLSLTELETTRTELAANWEALREILEQHRNAEMDAGLADDRLLRKIKGRTSGCKELPPGAPKCAELYANMDLAMKLLNNDSDIQPEACLTLAPHSLGAVACEAAANNRRIKVTWHGSYEDLDEVRTFEKDMFSVLLDLRGRMRAIRENTKR